MTKEELIRQIQYKRSLLCVGLDTDIDKIPRHLLSYDQPILEFNRRIIEATSDHCIAYKFNIAFYESLGPRGWDILEQSLSLIPSQIFTIADAKRGDIGNTSKMYAKTFFETLDFDAITVSPYMGLDSIEPFYSYANKWVIILGLTSNGGNRDVQLRWLDNGKMVYEETMLRCATLGNPENTMFVVGATNTHFIERIRNILPDHFFLIPGIGAQGGDLQQTLQYGLNNDFGLLINSSRGVIYASDAQDFAGQAQAACIEMNENMNESIHFSYL